MTGSTYRPSPLVPVRTVRAENGWTLVFTRELPHPPEKVWRALTSRDELRRWAPYGASRDLAGPGAVTLVMLDGDAETQELAGTVLRHDPPRLLEHAFGDDVLSWRLEPIGDGTRLVLRHTFADRDDDWSSALAAGWHLCLDAADALLAGEPIGPVAGSRARDYGWDELNERYAKALGVEPARP